MESASALGYTGAFPRDRSTRGDAIRIRGSRRPAALRGLAAAAAPRSDRAGDVALVQPRGRGDALSRSRRVSLLRSCAQLPAAARRRRRAGRLAAEGGRRGRRPRRRLHAELSAVSGRAVRDPARERRRGAGQSDEPRRGVQALHQRSRHQGRDLQRRPGGDRRCCQRRPARERARSRDRRDALRRRDAGRRHRRGRRAAGGDGRLAARRSAASGRMHALDRRARRNACSPGRIRRRRTTWRSCPTRRERPDCRRAACTRIAR